jgi:putative hydrolase of the HAD superfamily
MRGMTRAVLFDLDDTLYPYEPSHAAGLAAACGALAAARGVPHDSLPAAYYAARERAFERLGPIAAAHSRHLYFKWVLEELGGEFDASLAHALAETYWAAALAAMRPAPGAEALLRVLRAAGVRLGVLTDLTVGIQMRKLTRLGMAGAFDVVVTSEEAGRDKPDPAGFRLACERLGVEPTACVMIGDNPVNDIQGAAGVGMPSAWLGSEERPLPADARRIQSLEDLLEAEALRWLGVEA